MNLSRNRRRLTSCAATYIENSLFQTCNIFPIFEVYLNVTQAKQIINLSFLNNFYQVQKGSDELLYTVWSAISCQRKWFHHAEFHSKLVISSVQRVDTAYQCQKFRFVLHPSDSKSTRKWERKTVLARLGFFRPIARLVFRK